MTKTLGTIFTENKKLKPTERVKWLRSHAGLQMYYFLWLALSGKATWILPKGKPAFKTQQGRSGRAPRAGNAASEIAFELRRMYMFLEGSGETISSGRREKIFAAILESLSGEEADLLIAVKDGTFETNYKCSKKLVEETFPGLLEAPFTNRLLRK